ncbi:MAG: VWA domain-containing protein [Gammaproteobacteria bacterium]
MARKRRQTEFFTMSFLDVMSCGFGAVLMLYLVLRHDGRAPLQEATPPDLRSEVRLLQEQVRQGNEDLVRLRNEISEIDQEVITAQGLARQVREQVGETEGTRTDADAAAGKAEVRLLQEDLKRLAQEKDATQREIQARAADVRSFAGEGTREYLTGLKLGGQRVLILLDASTSMLADTIVNVIRRRNMSEDVRKRSEKWRQAVATVDWLTARLPRTSQFQIYTFAEGVAAAVPGTDGRWLPVSGGSQLEQAVANVKKIVPAGGTNMEGAFAAIGRLAPAPDTVLLITDGLPTQGAGGPRGQAISGPDRLRLFEKAFRLLPRNVPISTILLPMEGDPRAASAFWQVAYATRGAFLAPASDWP